MSSRRIGTCLLFAFGAASVAATLHTAIPPSETRADRRSTPANRVSFFSVPLGCPAVAGLGCGSLARPIMAQIERHPKVSQVWIDHGGTVLAVARSEGADHSASAVAVEAAFRGRGMDAPPLEGAALDAARQEFASSEAKWYSTTDVDRLSEEEARVVAARIVGRVERHVPMPPKRSRAFRDELASAFHRCFTAGCSVGAKEILGVAEKYLDARGLARFRESLGQGLAPLPGEN